MQVNSCAVSKSNNNGVFLHHKADACYCAKNAEILQTELSSQVKLLKDIVQSKTAVPTAKVFVSIMIYYMSIMHIYISPYQLHFASCSLVPTNVYIYILHMSYSRKYQRYTVNSVHIYLPF